MSVTVINASFSWVLTNCASSPSAVSFSSWYYFSKMIQYAGVINDSFKRKHLLCPPGRYELCLIRKSMLRYILLTCLNFLNFALTETEWYFKAK